MYEFREANGMNAVVGNKVELNNAKNDLGAACLDGTVPVFYFRKGNGDGISKFHVFFEGGGVCCGIETPYEALCDACADRATTTLGSSSTYGEFANFDYDYMSTDPNINPLSYNWNTIYVKYCDGGVWIGNNDTLTKTKRNDGVEELYFRGGRTVDGVFIELINNYNFNAATDVLISGCSAGGLGIWMQTNHIYETYIPKDATFLSMPDSGFFLEYNNGGHLMDAVHWVYQYQNTSKYLDKYCKENKIKQNAPQWLCSFAQEVASFIKPKMFPLQSRYDAWQTSQELQSELPSEVNAYGQNFTYWFIKEYLDTGLYTSNHAAFLDSCHHHCGQWNSILIDNYNSSRAQFDFYYNILKHNKFFFQNVTYPCRGCC